MCQRKLSIVAAGMITCDLLSEHAQFETEQVTATMHTCWPTSNTCLIYVATHKCMQQLTTYCVWISPSDARATNTDGSDLESALLLGRSGIITLARPLLAPRQSRGNGLGNACFDSACESCKSSLYNCREACRFYKLLQTDAGKQVSTAEYPVALQRSPRHHFCVSWLEQAALPATCKCSTCECFLTNVCFLSDIGRHSHFCLQALPRVLYAA